MRTSLAVMTMMLFILFTANLYAQSVGGGGSGGGGLRGEPNSIRRAGCEEGRRTIFYEEQQDTGRHVSVVRECQNGSYYDLTDYIYNPTRRCTEGRREIWNVQDPSGDRSTSVLHVCTNGKWIPRAQKTKPLWPW